MWWRDPRVASAATAAACPGVALLLTALQLCGCGRLGFELLGPGGSGSPGADGAISGNRDGTPGEPGPGSDGSASLADSGPVGACVDRDIGSMLGTNLATGTAPGGSDHAFCGAAAGSLDVTMTWRAPAAGGYDFSVCSSSAGSSITLITDCGAAPAFGGLCASGCSSTYGWTFDAGEQMLVVVEGLPAGGQYQVSISPQ